MDDETTPLDLTSVQPATWESSSTVDDLTCEICGRSNFKNVAGKKRHITVGHGGTNTDAEKVSVSRRVQKELPGKGAPTAEQLTTASGKLLGYGTIYFASVVVDKDPRREQMTDDEADQLIDALSATPDEGKDIMRPLARIFAGTKLNKRVGRKVVDNMDAADSIMALLAMQRRWTLYLKDRNAAKPVQIPGTPMGDTRMDEGERVLVGVQPMQQRQGVVMTREMIEEMQRGR